MNIDGRQLAKEILTQLKSEVAVFSQRRGVRPILVDVVVGDNPVTESYVAIKQRRALEIGIEFVIERLAENVSQEHLVARITELQDMPHVAGLLVQLPLPQHIEQSSVIEAIRPELDVDGLTAENIRLLYAGAPRYVPATAAAVLACIDATDIADFKGLPTLVVGSGVLVGKPAAFLLRERGASVIVANRNTPNIPELARSAKLIICGAGSPGLLTGDMVSDGVVVIDAGTAESDGGISGDVDFASVSPKASFITPVPGGVGPLTVAMLLKNTVQSAILHREK